MVLRWPGEFSLLFSCHVCAWHGGPSVAFFGSLYPKSSRLHKAYWITNLFLFLKDTNLIHICSFAKNKDDFPKWRGWNGDLQFCTTWTIGRVLWRPLIPSGNSNALPLLCSIWFWLRRGAKQRSQKESKVSCTPRRGQDSWDDGQTLLQCSAGAAMLSVERSQPRCQPVWSSSWSVSKAQSLRLPQSAGHAGRSTIR